MGKILCITSGLTGIVNASLELVNRLQAAGHEVTYAAPRAIAPALAKYNISFAELPTIPAQPGPSLPDFKSPLKKISRLIYKYKNATRRKKQALQNIYPSAYLDLLKERQPDLVILDVELHEYIFCTKSQGLPFLLLSQWFSLWNQPGLPYLLTDTIPGKGWRGSSWAIRLSWWWVRRQRAWIFLKQKLASGFTDRRTTLLALARQENFPLRYISENYWPGPFTYAELPVICMTAHELEFPHEPRVNSHYVGPMVFTPRQEEEASEPLSTILDQQKRQQQVLIYCTLSTLSIGDTQFIHKLIAAVKDEKKWLLIIGMGGLIDQQALGELPENVFAFAQVPQLRILAQADCSINHGGIHSINECIHFKVPMLIYSGKRSDQNGCAARVAYHEIGLMADKDQDNANTIREKIKEVLSNPLYSTNLEQLHQQYLKYKNENRLENIIEQFLLPNSVLKKQAAL